MKNKNLSDKTMKDKNNKDKIVSKHKDKKRVKKLEETWNNSPETIRGIDLPTSNTSESFWTYWLDNKDEIVSKHKDKNKRKFKSGAIRDSEEGKEDYIETISWLALRRYAQYMTSKKSKYGEGNFKKGIPIESYERSLVRHLQKYLANKYEGQDIEKDEGHIEAIIFNAMGILHEEETAILKINNKEII